MTTFYHPSGERRAEGLLAEGYQPLKLPQLAEVSWQQQALLALCLMLMAELCIRALLECLPELDVCSSTQVCCTQPLHKGVACSSSAQTALGPP